MPTTGIFSGETEFLAAKLLNDNFKGVHMFSFESKLNVVDIWNALMQARACCGSDNFGDCLRWARSVVRKKRSV